MKSVNQEADILRIVYSFRKSIENWGEKTLINRKYKAIKASQIPYLINIPEDGITNNELALNMQVSKQASSKIANELMKSGWIKSKKMSEDERMKKLYLSAKGRDLVLDVSNRMTELSNQYIDIVGQNSYDTMIKVMLELINFHHELK